jgi:hypothetical protein
MAKPKQRPSVLERLDDENAKVAAVQSKTNLPSMGWKTWPRWQKALVITLFAVIALSYVISISLIRR